MNELNDAISLNINKIFKEKGKFRSKFCEDFKYNKDTVAKMFNSKTSFTIKVLEDIAKYASVSLEELIILNKPYQEYRESSMQASEPAAEYGKSLLDKIQELSEENGKKNYMIEIKDKEIESLKRRLSAAKK